MVNLEHLAIRVNQENKEIQDILVNQENLALKDHQEKMVHLESLAMMVVLAKKLT